MNKIRKSKIKTLVFSIIFAFVNLFTLATPVQNAYAEPQSLTDMVVEMNGGNVPGTENTTTSDNEPSLTDMVEDLEGRPRGSREEERKNETISKEDLCRDGLDGVAWLFCSKLDAGTDAVDFLYKKIESVLTINPISGDSEGIIRKIWEICRGITNIVFVILMLLVVLSQITGVGITNYGIKRALPKLLIAAIAVNLSFVICQYAVDLSNTIGISIRNLFSGIVGGMAGQPDVINFYELSSGLADYYEAMANGVAMTVGGVVLAFDTGAIFFLIPAVLVCLVAVLSGLLTIALRHVVVVLCVMIAPLAMVAMIFPNTTPLFRKWRHTFVSMLIFFPMFSLLFGASNLAGFALTKAAGEDGFMALVGTTIQLAPLILCWKLMRMSGTVLGGVYGTVSGVMSGLFVNPARRYAASLAMHRRAQTLAQVHPYTPSAKLMQYLEDRRISREIDIAEYSQHAKQRAAAFNANKKYKFNQKGQIKAVTKDGLEAYEMQAKAMQYQREILRDKVAMNEGLGILPGVRANKELSEKDKAILGVLDSKNVKAADELFAEQIHANDVDYRNALGRNVRFNQAINAYIDEKHKGEDGYRRHNYNSMNRYETLANIMGTEEATQYAAASAASIAAAQRQLRQGQFQKYFDNTVATQDVVNRLKELTTSMDATENIDAIIAGMRTLNQRGDGRLLRQAIMDLCADEKLKVGTAASQALANFVMFEVKDNDPFIRRFGKYINLETARYYNTDAIAAGKDRRRQNIDMNEYVNDGYELRDEDGNIRYDSNGHVMRDTPKRGMSKLLMGTSFKGVEREAYIDILEGIHDACKGDKEQEKKMQKNALDAIMANVVGDQFNYPSGSEQINALTKFITGMKVSGYKDGDLTKPEYEWDRETLMMFSDNEEEAKQIALERTQSFLNAQVPNQIARTKSDLLGAVQELFVKKSAEEFKSATKSDAFKKWQQEEAANAADKDHILAEGSTAQDRYAHFLFRNSLKDATRGNLAKSLAKGFQGDTKENLIKAMGYNDYKNGALMNDEILKYTTKPIKYSKDNDDEDENDDGFDTSSVWNKDRAHDAVDVFKAGEGSSTDKLDDVMEFLLNHPDVTSDHLEFVRELREGVDSRSFNNEDEIITSMLDNLK